MLTDATIPCMTEINVLTMATGAETIASNLNDETPKTAKRRKEKERDY
jgi:hypothetical protein